MGGIKYLELWQVRKLKNIGVISTLIGLQFLFLQSLPQIDAIIIAGIAAMRPIV
jgi:hypothetical protein